MCTTHNAHTPNWNYNNYVSLTAIGLDKDGKNHISVRTHLNSSAFVIFGKVAISQQGHILEATESTLVLNQV